MVVAVKRALELRTFVANRLKVIKFFKVEVFRELEGVALTIVKVVDVIAEGNQIVFGVD